MNEGLLAGVVTVEIGRELDRGLGNEQNNDHVSAGCKLHYDLHYTATITLLTAVISCM